MSVKMKLLGLTLFSIVASVSGKTAFEKLTEYDFQGSTYYTIRNLSLWECQGWCREEPECAAASFSFVLNPLAPVQETLCLLQNDTLASNPSSVPQRAVSLYYMVKLHVRSENVCTRPWTFERVPNMMLKGLDDAVVYANAKEDCLAACLDQKRFTCRSCEYNHVTLECRLSQHDRRSTTVKPWMTEAKGVDYFENLCLSASQSCAGNRDYVEPKFGIYASRIAHYVDLHYYVDKELMANSAAACKRACEIEVEFLCRSFLYKGEPSGGAYNCQLFHMDHFSLPDGPETFLSTDRPLLDDGSKTGTYYENTCKADISTGDGDSSGSSGSTTGEGTGTQTSSQSSSQTGSQTTQTGSQTVTQTSTQTGSHSSSSQTGGHHYDHNNTTGGLAFGGLFPTQPTTAKPGGSPSETDVNCDPSGVCYDVSVHCKDTRIVVEVSTTRPFNGRVYALGRSETCNVDVISSDEFRLDLTMEGQDCNTQSAGGVYSNTIVIQHHSVVMTKTDKIYKVRCTYDMSSKNITFGMMPIRDPAMIPITSAPEAPPPRIRILDATLKEVQTVRIGDKLTFRIEIPEETPYGIFARSCVAMAKDSRSTFQIIDDDGCPVEPAIFPHFVQSGSALQAVYEAFRFTESYGVIFQCNVKYCLGECKPVKCRMGNTAIHSFGKRKKRGLRNTIIGDIQETTKEEVLLEAKGRMSSEEEMSISQEILVLDLGDEQSPQYKRTSKETVEERVFPNTTHRFEHQPEVTLFETCPTRSSVLALSVTCAILLLIYVLTVFYFVMRKWSTPPKHLR